MEYFKILTVYFLCIHIVTQFKKNKRKSLKSESPFTIFFQTSCSYFCFKYRNTLVRVVLQDDLARGESEGNNQLPEKRENENCEIV